MRRYQSTHQDPDVEESRAELEHLEGKKGSAQTEVLAIAANKKQLESDFDDVRKHLDAEIETKKKEIAALVHGHDVLMNQFATEKENARIERDKAIEMKEQSDKDLDLVRKEVADRTGKKESLDEVVKSLTEIEHSLRGKLARLAPEVRIMEGKKVTLFKELTQLEDKFHKLEDSHKQVGALHVEQQVAHATLVKLEGVKRAELDEVNTKLAITKEAVVSAQGELVDIQKKRAEHETEMQKRESAANARMANATHLEQRINVKLEQLKEAEKEFTVEHLARIGYKPIA